MIFAASLFKVARCRPSDCPIHMISLSQISSLYRMATRLQSSSNSSTFPGISHRGVDIYSTIRGIQTGLRVLLSEYCGSIGSPSCAFQLYLTVLLRLCLFCDYIATVHRLFVPCTVHTLLDCSYHGQVQGTNSQGYEKSRDGTNSPGYELSVNRCSCGRTEQANHNFLDFSLTNIKFPDFFRFFSWVVTRSLSMPCTNMYVVTPVKV